MCYNTDKHSCCVGAYNCEIKLGGGGQGVAHLVKNWQNFACVLYGWPLNGAFLELLYITKTIMTMLMTMLRNKHGY